jgi:O-methyltransferase
MPDLGRVKAVVRGVLVRLGLYRLDRRLKKIFRIAKYEMRFPPYGAETHKLVISSIDVVRYAAVALALNRIRSANVPGDLAEVGVYKGDLSRFMARLAPERTLHLFDTFSGFPAQDCESDDEPHDHRFKDTSVDQVKQAIGGDCANVIFHVGYFPDTAGALTAEKFAFVTLDADKYQPTLAALEVFYPRMSKGGDIFVHDYNSPESSYGVSRAVNGFFQGKPEQIVELPDRGGSVIIRKL